MTIKSTDRPARAAKPAARPPVRKGAEAPSRFRFKRPDFRFGQEIYSELKKVTWPNVQQTRDLTVVVIAISTAVGAFLGGVDFLFSKAVEIFLLNPPV